MKHLITLIPFLALFSLSSPLPVSSQTDFRIMSYNVENLFDCQHDEGKNDTEYLPSGSRRWTPGRYYRKLQQVAKVILAAGHWSTPALIGLCEVENDSVVIHLLGRTPLRSQHYRYVITDSPDRRGIDVALLYQPDKFALAGQASYRIVFTKHTDKHSRDILHVWGKVITGDTLDVFVCHYPSRYGGELTSLPDRRDAARLLREKTDSLFHVRQTACIIIMGDFNDTPSDPSIAETLQARVLAAPYTPCQLYNLFNPPPALPVPGSHKYQGKWSLLDQFIVSGALLDTVRPFHIQPGSPTVFAPSFLFTNDKTYRGLRPRRTYYGFKYEGGYSDHLPITVDLSLPATVEDVFSF